MTKNEIGGRQRVGGFYSALPTPFREDGRPDFAFLDAFIEFLLEKGVEGFCGGGLTGEYPIFGVEDRIQIYKHIAKRTAGRASLIFGAGGESSAQVLRMAAEARDLGAVALLLPPPSFFHAAPIDVQETMGEIASSLPLPVILYFIPQFVSSLTASNVLALLGSVENIVGVKDSSGDVEALEQFASAKPAIGFQLLAGNDNLLFHALKLQADGCISGLSSMAPDLMLGLYRAYCQGDVQRAAELQSLVKEIATAVEDLPVAWGIKIALEVQGFPMGSLNWPCGPHLAARIVKFREWYEQWAPSIRERLSVSSNSSQLNQDSLRN